MMSFDFDSRPADLVLAGAGLFPAQWTSDDNTSSAGTQASLIIPEADDNAVGLKVTAKRSTAVGEEGNDIRMTYRQVADAGDAGVQYEWREKLLCFCAQTITTWAEFAAPKQMSAIKGFIDGLSEQPFETELVNGGLATASVRTDLILPASFQHGTDDRVIHFRISAEGKVEYLNQLETPDANAQGIYVHGAAGGPVTGTISNGSRLHYKSESSTAIKGSIELWLDRDAG